MKDANRGFTFFRKPTLNDNEQKTLNPKLTKLLQDLAKKCEEDPNYVLSYDDIKELSPEDLPLVEKIFNTVREEAARKKKAAQLELVRFRKAQFKGLSKVETKILEKLLADPANQPTSFSQDGIAVYKKQIQSLVAAEKRIILEVANRQYYYLDGTSERTSVYLDDLTVKYENKPVFKKVIQVLQKDIKLAKAAFDVEALSLAHYSKEAAKKADLSQAEETIVSFILKSEAARHSGRFILDVGPAGYKKRVDDTISTVTFMEKVLLTRFKGVNELGQGQMMGQPGKFEDKVTVAELQTAFKEAVDALPQKDADKKLILLKIGEQIISCLKEDKGRWSGFRRSAGLAVDDLAVKIDGPQK